MTSIKLLEHIQEEYHWESAIFFKGDFEIIKQDLEELEKLKKVVEIIKRKGFDVLIFESNDYETYKKIWSKYYDNFIKLKQKHINDFCDKCKLYTQEEFNLLKEVFK